MNKDYIKRLIGKNVIAQDVFNGTYIAELIGFSHDSEKQVEVKILACLKYPRQNAIFFKDKVCERKPYKFGSIKKFNSDGILSYSLEVPDYHESVITALNKEIEKNSGVQLFKLLRHKKLYEQVAV